MMRAAPRAAVDVLPCAESPREKLAIGRFMSSQFFAGQRPDIRERISEANARCPNAEFYAFTDRSRPQLVGAAMLMETEAAVGIYNVCVTAQLRGRGWGTSIVRALAAECGRRAKPAVLQCEFALEPWYTRFGFETSGCLNIWSPIPR
jgi:hypothetical protein